MYTYDDFVWFVEEREKIRLQKDAVPKPWTTDPILRSCRFTNIDRLNDRGSLLLIDFIKGMSDREKLFYIILYRSCYSSPKFLSQMTGDWQNDYGNISTLKMKFVGSRIPYQIFLDKEQSISQFLISVACNVAHDFNKIFRELENVSILTASDILADLCKIYHGKRLIFLSTEIAKDLSYFYPERINPDSECHMNIGAMNALKIFPGRWQKVKIEKLLYLTGLKFSDLEHGLCEFNKWCERGEFYHQNVFFKKSWLY
jgi:hypothetical protein